MATALSQQAGGEPRVVGDIIALNAVEIDASGRLRPVDDAWAQALGNIMIADGQRSTIWVARQRGPKPWKLVAGGHRHRAAELFPELNPLRAEEVEPGSLAMRKAQAAENLQRRELSPLERATFIDEIHDVLRAQSGLAGMSAHQIAANARWKKDLRKTASDASDIMSRAYGFTEEIAAQFGYSKRSIERDLMLARRLSVAARERLIGHPILGNATQLRALAKLDIDQQGAVVDSLVAGARSVAEAVAQLSHRPKPSLEDKRLSSFIGTYARMSIAEKKGALAQLAGMLPAGFRLVEGGAQ